MSAIRRYVLALVVVAALVTVPGAPALARGPAPGGPGAASHFGMARKDCVGTSAGRASKVWYMVAGGLLSDVYEPTIDNTNVETMQFVVTDGRTFTELQSRDTTYRVATDASGMICTITSTSRRGRYRLTTTYVTDPDRNAVVVRTRLRPAGLRLYARLDASVNGNGGGAGPNGGADSGAVDAGTGAPVVWDDNTETSAPARDYAVPTHLALRAERRLPQASVGYAGTPGDGSHTTEEIIQTTQGGYRLVLEPDHIDAHLFVRLVKRARTAQAQGGGAAADALFRAALQLWRGEPPTVRPS
ncbi:hypothetical protein HCN51_57250 [Nonomuraea sp. FMUSA5-5]|uniref:Uncharacterized protein n=1 Tax=Nonomuraea composti TaxID=2720023 RepID=A0ABX1BQX1_9ACTN|nr:BTAD domain-containing putative transcriptional regulator [Nonomuraea sp. FMUSA5-5]NJP98872.1 hypothetical protein [Nonomuraea sp. FMUSA5-5]